MGKQTQPRSWEINRFDPHTGDELLSEAEFRQAVAEALIEAEGIGHRVGGAFLLSVKRAEVAPGVWIVTAWRFIWQSFAPGSERHEFVQPAAVPEPEPDDESEDDEMRVEGLAAS